MHKRPSGDPTPSNADITTTINIKKAGQLMEIFLYDHLIIGKNKWKFDNKETIVYNKFMKSIKKILLLCLTFANNLNCSPVTENHKTQLEPFISNDNLHIERSADYIKSANAHIEKAKLEEEPNKKASLLAIAGEAFYNAKLLSSKETLKAKLCQHAYSAYVRASELESDSEKKFKLLIKMALFLYKQSYYCNGDASLIKKSYETYMEALNMLPSILSSSDQSKNFGLLEEVKHALLYAKYSCSDPAQKKLLETAHKAFDSLLLKNTPPNKRDVFHSAAKEALQAVCDFNNKTEPNGSTNAEQNNQSMFSKIIGWIKFMFSPLQSVYNYFFSRNK